MTKGNDTQGHKDIYFDYNTIFIGISSAIMRKNRVLFEGVILIY